MALMKLSVLRLSGLTLYKALGGGWQPQ